MVERSPQGGGNRPGPGPDLHQAPVVVLAHHHPARVARQALGRFRGNARAAIEHGLPRLIRIGQHLGINVDHHLVALARGTGIEVVQGRLRKQGQGIRLLLGQRGRFRGNAPGSAAASSRTRARWYRVSRAAASAWVSSAPPPARAAR